MKETSPFTQLCQQRRSCRHFTGELLPREMVIDCIEAALMAPSACAGYPVRWFVTCDREKIVSLTREAMGRAIPNRWLVNAGAVAALAMEPSLLPRLGARISGIQYADMDTGIAGEHLVLRATELGLGSCWIGWFNEKGVRRILDIPTHMPVRALIALGWPQRHLAPARKKVISKFLVFR